MKAICSLPILASPVRRRFSYDQFIHKIKKQFEVPTVKITIDLFPDRTADEVFEDSMSLARQEPKKAIKNVLKGLVPERMIPILLKKSGSAEHITFDNIPKRTHGSSWLSR